ncbi:hypothetical protein ONZ45_g16592 [Pleurotus djamor]|nr:hypothetical protein ONZ45_g16592 [Pleurotus djamor]
MHEAHRERVADWLSGAIRIPTETFDDMLPVGNDSRWDIFASFHDYLVDSFPLTFTSLSVTKVNTYGVILAWEGSELAKKPILLTAHQDVVPVDPKTLHQWTYPPYSGFNDGQKIWGRGSSDDKNGLIGLLATVELLLEARFKPSRSIVLAFGFDEESSGEEGAGKLAPVLLDTYGQDGFAMIVDEGDGFGPQYGAVFATPSISEKGYLDVKVEVKTPGGHSSLPPAHTSIGILSALLVELEEHPHPFHLFRHSPVFLTLQCLAVHAPGLPLDLRRSIYMAVNSDRALRALELQLSTHPIYGSLMQTTQAITMVQGGIKSNALPEDAWALINHRISTTSSVSETIDRIAGMLRPLATNFNLSFHAFDAEDSVFEDRTTLSNLILSDAWGTALEPAPTTPIEIDAAPYSLLASSIKATYNVCRNLTGDNIIVYAPGRCEWSFEWAAQCERIAQILSAGFTQPLLEDLQEKQRNAHTWILLRSVRVYVPPVLFDLMTTCLPTERLPSYDDDKKAFSPDVVSVTDEATAVTPPLGAPVADQPRFFWQRLKRHDKDLDAIATQPSVFDEPAGLEAYKPPSEYENAHRFDPSARWTWREELRVVRKIDFRIMIWACIMFFGLELDRSNISQANTDNFLDDLNLSTNDFNLGNTLFRLCFLIAELPSQLVSKRVGPDVWIPTQMSLWGAVAFCQFWIKGRASFLACRCLLGFLQGGFIPDVVLYLSYFYTKSELPIRLAYFWVSSYLTDIVSAFLATGILRLRGVGGHAGWRYLFLIEGLLTFSIGVSSYFLMPAGPTQTKTWFRPRGWFNEREEIIMVNRILRDDPSKSDMHNREGLSPRMILEALKDWRMWPIYALGITHMLPVGPPHIYLTLSLRNLGFNTTEANLLSIPSTVIGMVMILFTSYFSEVVDSRVAATMILQLWALPLLIALYTFTSETSQWVYYAVVTLITGFPYIHPIQVAWASRNSYSVRTR